ncbi:alkaline phosphatase D family protein [Porphyrobacter sp. ULC335]|uniref:alkaline phosphatase D family protein n=1 Tax=Porphyrobacter sp. ULC335 TaxID=2854260 RepID=UPI00221EAEB8|nr:alkaline phosphatase D family protein [Porphyrobacter sp. ULC335]UYV14614.1 alkaline phosphatase D family protein [Porphyrobacter sp. ULC335]
MFNRRHFLGSGIVAAGSVLLLPAAVRAAIKSNPFTLGIASGSPRDTSVMLWTRLAPDPLRGGGMPLGDVPVRLRIWADDAAKRLVREMDVVAVAEDAHSIHERVEGLEPGREYWYRFSVGDYESALGRTRTTSRASSTARLAVASCQSWQSGHYAAYADMAAWAPDCVVHVGDYIYEGGTSDLGKRTAKMFGEDLTFNTVRQHNGPEIVTLWDYRNRYALYKTDPSLQAAHAASPWIVAMDDHEIDNNWASDTPQDPWAQTPLEWQVRRIAAFKAYYEHMPIDRPPVIDMLGTALQARLQMYGLYRFGPAQVHLLDTRQFRADQVCGEGFPGQTPCPEAARPDRTMLGAGQEKWLADALRRSDAKFNVLASQVWLTPYRYNQAPEPAAVNFDAWDGYAPARQRLFETLADGVSNPVSITGDWHCAAASRLHLDPFDVRSKRVGVEFSGTSISSDCPWSPAMERARADNPHVAHHNGRQRGYCRFDVDTRHWATTYRVVADPLNPNSAVGTDVEIRVADL